jgi:hypothetical protein
MTSADYIILACKIGALVCVYAMFWIHAIRNAGHD